jgi:hypothetical protein
LRPSDSDARLNGIAAEMTNLEQLCNELELGLRSRDFARMERALNDSRRVMHAFRNAMAESKPLRTAEFDRVVFARLQRIYSIHQDQMGRLGAVRDDAAERLRTIAKFREYARSIGGSKAQRNRAKLFQDLR